MTVPRRIARTRRLDGDVDLLDVTGAEGVLFSREGVGLAGRGRAATLTVSLDDPAGAAGLVDSFFATIERDDEVQRSGTGPVALGALPFDRTRPGTLTVPEVVVGRAPDGTRWITTVGLASEPETDPHTVLEQAIAAGTSPGAEAAGPGTFAVEAEMDPERWCGIVGRARDELRRHEHHKVVLARAVSVTADAALDRLAILARLRRAYPTCMVFAAGEYLGATPELLVSRQGDIVRGHPMAGTAPRSADPATDSRLAAGLLASAKDREEHQITIDMVHDTLLPWCSYLDWEPEPSIVAVANVQHLATRMEGRLSDPAPSVLELVGALHPTPAVGGHPRDQALDLIARLEDLDRGCYAGPVGWVDGDGNGEWAVGIRSAAISGRSARCFAGVGVVADSDPAAELAETRVKLQALLSAIVTP